MHSPQGRAGVSDMTLNHRLAERAVVQAPHGRRSHRWWREVGSTPRSTNSSRRPGHLSGWGSGVLRRVRGPASDPWLTRRWSFDIVYLQSISATDLNRELMTTGASDLHARCVPHDALPRPSHGDADDRGPGAVDGLRDRALVGGREACGPADSLMGYSAAVVRRHE